MNGSKPVLTIDNVSIRFPTAAGTVNAVRNVTLSIARGEIVGLVGESGCGKSTLGYAVMGDLAGRSPQTSGSISYGGIEILTADSETLRQLRGGRIAMVHQNPAGALTPTARIGRQLEEILIEHQKITRPEARRKVVALLTQVRLPDAERIMERFPHQLSGGQQQRVIIAAALLGNPDLLVLDEPTTGLDVTVEASVIELLRELRQETGVAMLFIAHNLGLIAGICDRVGVMYAGELVEMADVRTIFRAPRHPYAARLLSCVPRIDRVRTEHPLRPIPGQLPTPFSNRTGCLYADRCDYAQPGCSTTQLVFEMTGQGGIRCLRWKEIAPGIDEPVTRREIAAPLQRQENAEVADVLEAAGITVRYSSWLRGRRKTATVLDNIDLRLASGRVTAVVGESGSGKTTLGRAIVGLTALSSGRLLLRGKDISRRVGRRPAFVHRLLQMVFQDHYATLNPSLTVGRIVARPLRLLGIVPRRQENAETIRLLGAVGLDTGISARHPSQLSGGQKQRVAIARAFAGRPDLVVCDEITSALDVSVQAAVLAFLKGLQESSGTSLLFISHDLGVVRYIADEVFVMYLGGICERGPADSVFRGPNHPYTLALLSAAPVPDAEARPRVERLEGIVPSVAARPTGCSFHTRCPRKIGAICETTVPPTREAAPGHLIECHHEISALAGFRQRVFSPPLLEADNAQCESCHGQGGAAGQGGADHRCRQRYQPRYRAAFFR